MQVGLQPDTAVYNSVLRLVAAEERFAPAALEEVMADMVSRGVRPDRRSYFLLLQAHARHADLDGAKRVLQRMARDGASASLSLSDMQMYILCSLLVRSPALVNCRPVVIDVVGAQSGQPRSHELCSNADDCINYQVPVVVCRLLDGFIAMINLSHVLAFYSLIYHLLFCFMNRHCSRSVHIQCTAGGACSCQ